MKRKKEKRERHGKHADLLKRPPAICLKCGPADKMAVVPKACEKCWYRGAADDDVAKKIAEDMANTEMAARMTWEVAGRCLDDLNKKCPAEIFDKIVAGWLCEIVPTEHILCPIEVDQRGEEIHPHWRCWAAWLGHEMAMGSYSPVHLEARRLTILKKKRKVAKNNEGKDNE